MWPKIYIMGASCSGVSTLGARLAKHLAVLHLDVDDYYWQPTDPPFTTKRPPQDRVRLLQYEQRKADGWVLAGSFIGWGDALIQDVTLIVFLLTPTPIRLQRLDEREAMRYGARILPGGDMYEAHLAFKEWASQYDDPLFSGRNMAQHERWLSEQTAPVLQLRGDESTELLMHSVVKAVSQFT